MDDSPELSPHHRDLVYQATLASFWRRRALGKFLRSCGISEAFVATWSGDESKRHFLDRVFEKLADAKKGDRVLLSMSKALCEQATFPDLKGWEDSKEKIQQAALAVEALKQCERKRAEDALSIAERTAAQARHRARVEETQRARMDLNKLNQRLAELSRKLGTQEGGYEFQLWFYDLLDYFEILSRRPYVIDGRQIDGSLTLDGTTYLVELKFCASKTEAPDVDIFLKKVHDKADNTMGIFVSMSGYTSGALKTASGPRTPLMLLDHEHIYAALTRVMTLPDILARLRRHASQTAEAHLPPSRFGG